MAGVIGGFVILRIRLSAFVNRLSFWGRRRDGSVSFPHESADQPEKKVENLFLFPFFEMLVSPDPPDGKTIPFEEDIFPTKTDGENAEESHHAENDFD